MNGCHSDVTGEIYHRWYENIFSFDPIIKEKISYTLMMKIKSVYKLNNNLIIPPKVQVGCDTSDEFRLIWNSLCKNDNALA